MSIPTPPSMAENIMSHVLSQEKDDDDDDGRSTNRSTVAPLTHNLDHHQENAENAATTTVTTAYQAFQEEDEEENENPESPPPTFSERNHGLLHRPIPFADRSHNLLRKSFIKDSRRWNGPPRRSSMQVMGLASGVGFMNRRSLNAFESINNNDNNNNDRYNNMILGGGSNDDNNNSKSTTTGLFRESIMAQCAEGDSCIDQSLAVDSFFNSIRVPSSFIVGASFSELFGSYNNNSTNNSDDENSTVQIYLRTLCVVCQGFTFALSLSVIILSSSALVRGLTANFDPFAENGYELLFREFHFEFVCVRWAYSMSMFGFFLAVGAKILYEFELFNVGGENFDRSQLEIGIAVVLIMAAMTMHLFSYWNSTLIGWENMTDMTLDMIKMIIHRGKEHITEAISLGILAVGLVFLILGLIPGAQI